MDFFLCLVVFLRGDVGKEERDFGFSPMYCPLKYPSQSQSSVNEEKGGGGKGTGKERVRREQGNTLNSACNTSLTHWPGKEKFYILRYFHS